VQAILDKFKTLEDFRAANADKQKRSVPARKVLL
jgi:hypothetical protein